jgi:hypothetical protein
MVVASINWFQLVGLTVNGSSEQPEKYIHLLSGGYEVGKKQVPSLPNSPKKIDLHTGQFQPLGNICPVSVITKKVLRVL